MSASRNRQRWAALPVSARAGIETLLGERVVEAHNCPGGFSPGFASRLVLADGRRAFVKAIDGDAWPGEAPAYRVEARVGAGLPRDVPAPRLLGTADDGHWVILAFEDVDGAGPPQPWDPASLARVAAALVESIPARTPSPIALARDHPRLGGWGGFGCDAALRQRLSTRCPWAAANLSRLRELEAAGVAAAAGTSLVHFDLHPDNVLLTPERVVFVDWPHARLGAPLIDLVMLLASAAADGVDPDAMLRTSAAGFADEPALDAILAAHAGFLLAGGLATMPTGLEPIAAAKLRLGLGALDWLRHRLARRSAS